MTIAGRHDASWTGDIQHPGIGFYTADANGCFMSCNPAITAAVGYSQEELAGRKAVDLIVEEERDRVQLQYRAWATDPSIHDVAIETRVRTRDGRILWVEQLTHIERDVDGQLVQYNNFLRDITERKSTEARLRANEQRFQRVVEAISDALAVVDLQMRLVFVNDRFLEMSGRRREEVASLTLRDIMAPLYHDVLRERMRRRQAGEHVNPMFEGEMVRPDGTRIWVGANVSPVVEGGQLAGTQWLIRDITDRHVATERLTESERRFRAVFDESPNALLLSESPEIRFIDANSAATAFFGFTRDELVGRNGLELNVWVNLERRNELLQQHRAGRELTEREVVFRRKDGTTFPALLSTRKLSLGGRSYILFSVVDITRLRQAEQDVEMAMKALSNSVSLLEATLESTADGILVVANDRSISRFNRRFVEMWRIPQEVIDSRDDARALECVVSQLRDPQAFLASVERLYASADAESKDVLDFIDGRQFERYSRPQVVDGVTVGRVWSFRDVTERRQAEVAHARLEAGLRQAQKLEAVGTLAGGIAHDFNNILTAIIASAEDGRTELSPDHPMQENLQTIHAAAQRAASLVRRILLFSRGEVGTRSSVRLEDVVREALELLRPSLPASVEISVTFRSPEPPPILADATQVQQVIVNVCTNAWHAMRGRGGGQIALEVTGVTLTAAQVQAEGMVVSPGRYARIAVSDTGAGISPATLPRIFDPFFTTKPVGEGTGLGLAIVHGIVRGHGGDVTVTSTEGSGSTFRVYLPLAHASETAIPPLAPVPRGNGERVLIVDDEPAICSVTSRVLEKLGYRVLTAFSGEEALTLLRAPGSDISLLLTDLTMPGMTGIELTARARELMPGLPTLLCTGFGSRETDAQVAALRIDGLLMKPHSMRDLGESIARALQRPRP